jgi:hypothetical protein
MALSTFQGIFLLGATAILGSAVVKKMKGPKKKICKLDIYSSGPEPLRDDIVEQLKPAAKQATEGKPYYLTPSAQARGFELFAKAYTDNWWPRSLAVRKVLSQMTSGCNWYGDQATDFTPEMFFVWQSMWTLASVVEADMGINRMILPAKNNIIAREQLGLPLGPNGEKKTDEYAVFLASDTEGKYTEEIGIIARDWRMENGVVFQKYQILGHKIGDKWQPPRFYKYHGYNMTDDIELANAYTLIG